VGHRVPRRVIHKKTAVRTAATVQIVTFRKSDFRPAVGSAIFETMPIYEYSCKACGHEFEMLVRGGKTPACKACGAIDLERRFSLPNVASETTKAQAMRAAKRRDQAQATERVQAQINYEKSHDD